MPQKNALSADQSGVRIVEICGESLPDCIEAEKRIQAMIDEHNDKSKANFGKNPYGTGYAMF